MDESGSLIVADHTKLLPNADRDNNYTLNISNKRGVRSANDCTGLQPFVIIKTGAKIPNKNTDARMF